MNRVVHYFSLEKNRLNHFGLVSTSLGSNFSAWAKRGHTKMDGNEEGDGWGDIDPGDFVWEQEAASLSMFEPPPFTPGFCDIWEFRVGLGRRFSALAREQGGGGEGQGIRGQRGKRWGELCDTPVVTAWGGACAPWLPDGCDCLGWGFRAVASRGVPTSVRTFAEAPAARSGAQRSSCLEIEHGFGGGLADLPGGMRGLGAGRRRAPYVAASQASRR